MIASIHLLGSFGNLDLVLWSWGHWQCDVASRFFQSILIDQVLTVHVCFRHCVTSLCIFGTSFPDAAKSWTSAMLWRLNSSDNDVCLALHLALLFLTSLVTVVRFQGHNGLGEMKLTVMVSTRFIESISDSVWLLLWYDPDHGQANKEVISNAFPAFTQTLMLAFIQMLRKQDVLNSDGDF